MFLVHVEECLFEVSDLLSGSGQLLVLLLDLCLILFNEGIVLHSHLVHHCVRFLLRLRNDLIGTCVCLGNNTVTFLLGAQKCILQCVLVPHVLPNLIRQHLNLVVAVVQLLLCGSDLLFQAVQKFINVLLLISKSSLFEPKFVDFTCTNHLGSPLTDIFES